jgi:signal transduction protein with GAF and PtsI domain
VSADRAYLLPPRSAGDSAAVPAELLEGVVRRRRAVMWTATASHRPQRRTNIELDSLLLVPAIRGDRVLGVVVCERHSARPFDAGDLERAMHAVAGLADTLGEVSGETDPQPSLSMRAQDRA